MAKKELNIIIIGAGEVGKGLARKFVDDGHHVKVIDINKSVLRELESTTDAMTIHGNGASASVLLQADIEHTNLVISVSDNDDRNMIASAVSKQYGVEATVARVRHEEYVFPNRDQYAAAMNIDLIINPDEVASQELYDLLLNPVANTVTDFANGLLKLVGYKVTKDAPISNRAVKDLCELGFSDSILMACLVRNDIPVIPHGNDIILPGDQAYVIAPPSRLDKANEMGGVTSRNLKKVVMVGASRMAYFLAEKFQGTNTRLSIIERDKDRCHEFASELTNVTIHHGDGTDIGMLRATNVADADGFVASSEDDETNILACLLAKEQGARRVITIIRKPQYLPLLEHIRAIDVAINPRVSTIYGILRYVQKGKILAMATIAQDRAEAIEVEVADNSTLIGRKLKENFLPKGVLLGAIIRDKKVIIPRGEDELQAGDHGLILALKKSIDKVDELFSRGERHSGLRRFIKSFTE